MVVSSAPKYKTLAELLARQIETGRLRVGDCLPGERRLATEHGMSHMTVNKAIASLVERGLVERREGMGTIIVEPIRAGTARYAGLVVDADPVDLPLLARSLPRALMERGRTGLLLDLSHPDGIAAQVRQLVGEGVSSFIIDGHSSFPFAALDGLPHLPRLVFVNRFEGPKRLPAAYVLFDYREAGRRAVRQLLAAGKRRIGVAGFERQPGWTSQLFYEGCLDMLAEAGLPLCGEWITRRMSEGDYEGVLAGSSAPDGIAAVNDFRLTPFARVAQRLGLRCPDDLAMVGLGDTVHAAAANLTALTYPCEAIAREAARLLDCDDNVEMALVPGLVERASCPVARY